VIHAGQAQLSHHKGIKCSSSSEENCEEKCIKDIEMPGINVFFHSLFTAPKSTFCPTEETWWPGLIIIIAVCCATLVFLFVVVIICYKAIKRKPMRKEENGTSRSEYAMTSSQNNKTVDNNAVV
uniref:Proline rich membrane anchor 1 n=1 Tax=Junco hyemalis TaxID=40217 RepID=A0A8C5IJ89_JUNHY